MKRNLLTYPTPISFQDSGYPEYFRRHAHTLISLGYAGARLQVGPETLEPDITLKLYECVKSSLDSLDLPEEIANRRYAVKAEDPKSAEGKTKFIDIVVEDPNGRPRNHFTFEAKRLRKKGDFSIAKYCGDDGMMRLVRGTHTFAYPEAAMIGFLQSNDAQYWEKKLKAAFTADGKSGTKKMCTTTSLRRVSVISSFPDEWVSTHTRTGNRNLTIFHIFVDCT